MSILGYQNLYGGDDFCPDCYEKAIAEDSPSMIDSPSYGEYAEGWGPIDDDVSPISIFATCSECGAHLRDDDLADWLRDDCDVIERYGARHRVLTEQDMGETLSDESSIRDAADSIKFWTNCDLTETTLDVAMQEL